MLHRYLFAELLKMRRSLALLLCVAAPSCVVVMLTLILLRGESPPQLDKYHLGLTGLWAFVMLPLALTALSVLMAQMEHGPRTWHHLLTLPGARPHAFLAKALMMLTLMFGMSLLLWMEAVAGSALIGLLRSDARGSLDAEALARLLARMAAASALVAMLQLWVALRFRSFVVPLVFGIAGTFAAIAASGAKGGIYFPWLMAFNMQSTPERQAIALTLGSAGAVVVLLAMVLSMNRREF